MLNADAETPTQGARVEVNSLWAADENVATV